MTNCRPHAVRTWTNGGRKEGAPRSRQTNLPANEFAFLCRYSGSPPTPIACADFEQPIHMRYMVMLMLLVARKVVVTKRARKPSTGRLPAALGTRIPIATATETGWQPLPSRSLIGRKMQNTIASFPRLADHPSPIAGRVIYLSLG